MIPRAFLRAALVVGAAWATAWFLWICNVIGRSIGATT